MGRKILATKQHAFYFKMTEHPDDKAGAHGPAAVDNTDGPAAAFTVRKEPEFFMEQVMEGLSDACIMLDGNDRIVYVNDAAKILIRPKGRILGRKLEAVLADRQVSMLAADAYQTGKPIFSKVMLRLPSEHWRDDRHFLISLVPVIISSTRRLVRIAMRDDSNAVHEARAASANSSPSVAMQLRSPLSVIQGYLENLLDGVISDPVIMRQSLLTMRKHTLQIERTLEGLGN